MLQLTACVQAVAYLVAILLHGFGSAPLSRCWSLSLAHNGVATVADEPALAVHAYYALVAALGYLCPLAASAVTAPHYNYGGSHADPGQILKAYGLSIRLVRCAGRPRPLRNFRD